MNRFIVHLVAMLALACASVASAQTTLETFETATGNAISFTSAGTTFNINTSNAGPFRIDNKYPGTGWNGTAVDNVYIDNDSYAAAGILPNFSLATADHSRFSVGSFWLYLSDHNLGHLGTGGSVTVTGKLAGATVFTTSASSGFNTSPSTSNGFSKIDLTTFGNANNASKVIDEIQIITGGQFEYVALDALTWTKAGYAISTAVTPAGAGTLTCAATSVSPGGMTTCSVTNTASGYELSTISGCNGTTSTTSSFTTGAINANCTVTATFVTALSTTTSKTDVSCNGGSNGVGTVNVSGGVAPYTYSWAPSGGTGATATGLSQGTYTVTVKDARNFQITPSPSVVISQPTALAMGPASIADGVVGASYSQALSASGGTPPYAYSVTSGSVPGLAISGATLAGAPTTTGTYSITIAATDANTCSTPKSYSSMQVRATVGGTLSGLAPGSVIVLANNGADTVTISADGAFTFATPLAQNAAYNVSIAAKSNSPAQFCSIVNGAGTVGAGNVGNVAVHCGSSLGLSVSDNLGYAAYGQALDYLVSLTNSTGADASGIHVASALSSAFNATATWQCLSNGSNGVACTGTQTSGALSDIATVPAGQTAQWTIHTTVATAPAASSADVGVSADFATTVTDSDTLVIFRNGFDGVTVSQALAPARAAAVAAGEETATFMPAPASPNLVDTLLTLPSTNGTIVHVQRLNMDVAPWLRLQWLDAGRERASAWQRASGDAPLAVGAIGGVILLEGNGVSVQLPLDASPQ